MTLATILAWIIFGGLAGWIASIIVGKNSQIGLLGNILFGIAGAVLAGWLLPNDGDQFDLGSFIAAIIGAAVILLIVNAIAGSSNRNRF